MKKLTVQPSSGDPKSTVFGDERQRGENIFFYVYLFLRDRVQAGEGQGETETQNLKQAPGSELSTQSLTRGSNSQMVRS